MAISRMNFRSEVLGKGTAVTVYLPDEKQAKMPVLYLLHGKSDDCNSWLNATSLERYASQYPFCIVMPQVELSYYTDMVYGDRYWTFLTEELPNKMHQWFQLKTEANQHFLAGLSMGGYGAFKWALRKPNEFRAVASLSGALDVVSLWEKDAQRDHEFSLIFGTKTALKQSNNDLLFLLDRQTCNQTAFFQYCGTEDFLYTENQMFRNQAQQALENYVYQEGPGDHTWEYWDATIQEVLRQFFRLLNE
ncbi:alpha/beta hydrolase [Enterococcus italicus]|uniref:Putative esterase n=1 Tax=Enterococcus italicus (strain DSM 15952 / CCUG 50447 / LMG 22039 / TP 1.5) TaxID=888064 RepID=E6LD92_ENTI1|nr:alpha/beta hydrolase family protein [Enterococcus italicus]EFU74766.1 putative esterase [Enterococcus italicus DSM 15952]OJG60643.1 tributyrin esterase [Enterococcus italicus DSM 15952]